MSIELTLWLERDESNDTAELFVRFKSAVFSGQGSAWIKLSQLRQFAECLSVYPLGSAPAPKLVGGYWDSTGSSVVDEHVHISVEPYGNLGALNMFVKVAVPQDGVNRATPKYLASVILQTDYAQISVFAKYLLSLAAGSEQEATLIFAE